MNASPVIQAGIDRPDRKKSVLVRREALQHEPDAEHEREVDDDDEVVDPLQLHPASAVVNTTQRWSSVRLPVA